MLASRVSVALPLLRARALRPRTSRALSVSAMAAPTPKLKLTYFNIKARAEPTRLALHIGGVPFEDVRIEHSAWPAMKASMPLGQIPVRSGSRAAALRALRARVACGGVSQRSLEGNRAATNPRVGGALR
jgi:hypothetical protein